MECFEIVGGNKLSGEIDVYSAKNCALVIIAASTLIDDDVVIHNCPSILDVEHMIKIVEELGATTKREGDTLIINSKSITNSKPHDEYSKKLRSSIFLMGPLISRFNRATMVYPGGCDIGLRPIDLHLVGLKNLGVEVVEKGGYVYCNALNKKAGKVHLDFPSVGATENLILASVFTKGITEIHNCAKEPEVVALESFLNSAGARISGAGTSVIHIEGVSKLHAVEYTPIPDRIVTGTYMIASALTKGDVLINNCKSSHIEALISKLNNNTCKIKCYKNSIHVRGVDNITSINQIKTMPYPGFPTDLQAPVMTLMSAAKGCGIINETMFETRFKHVNELRKLGANITVNDRIAIIRGRKKLIGCQVNAEDLRGGASLVLAGLIAEGKTTVNNAYHIDRGYYNIDQALNSIGAKIKRFSQ